MLLTVVTPTYNRANTLERTFDSLKKQTFHDFEWLIIDDGSSDNTSELVSQFERDCDFSIRYIKKKNGGKHTAYNIALDEALGELFFVVDSDDWLPDNSISDIATLAADILDNNSIGGIIALKTTSDGNVIGKPFQHENMYASFRDIELSGQAGERSIVFKTAVARKFPFPIIEGERFMPECVVYDNYNQDYKFAISNQILTICEYQADGLSSNQHLLMINNPGGYTLYYRNRIDMAITLRERAGYIIRYNVFRHLYKGNEITPYSGHHKSLCTILDILTPIVVRKYYHNI